MMIFNIKIFYPLVLGIELQDVAHAKRLAYMFTNEPANSVISFGSTRHY
jgi:hypothetical protein